AIRAKGHGLYGIFVTERLAEGLVFSQVPNLDRTVAASCGHPSAVPTESQGLNARRADVGHNLAWKGRRFPQRCLRRLVRAAAQGSFAVRAEANRVNIADDAPGQT